jgi:hypothetical protein
MNSKKWDDMFCDVQKEIHELYRKNRTDYVKVNDDPLSSLVRSRNLGVEPHIAALIRLGDKFNLLENFVKNGRYETHDESIRETLLDISSYATLTILLLEQGTKNE